MTVDEARQDETEVVFLLGTEVSTAEPEAVSGGTPRRGVAVVVVALVVAALWALFSGADTEPAPSDAEPAAADGTAVIDEGEARPTLAELTGSSSTLAVSASSSAGGANRILWWAPQDPEPTHNAEADLRHARFDASGQWVAGVVVAAATGGGNVLWAGRVDGPLQPVEVGVRGFAWHDVRPGHLAWSSATPGGGSSLVTVNLASAGPHRRARTVPSDDALRHWGDWGFVLTSRTRRPRTTILDHAAQIRVADVPGWASGWVPGLGVIGNTVEPAPSVVVLGDDGEQGSVDWARPGELAVAVARSPVGELTAVHLQDSSDASSRVVIVAAGEVVSEIDDVAGRPAPAWSADGTTLVLARQHGADQTTRVLFVDVGTGDVIAELDPGLDPRSERLDALALRAERPRG